MVKRFLNAGLLFGIGMVTLSTNAVAQNEVDALRFSNTYHGGTARVMGMGGAFSALGSDISSASINPAGLALYRSSDINFTSAIDVTKTKTNFLNESTVDHNYRFSAQSAGLVFSMPDARNYEAGMGRQNTVFGVTFNRINTFNQDVYAVGRNDQRSYLTHLTNYYNQNSDYWDLFWTTRLLFEDQNGVIRNDFDLDGNYQIKQTFEHRQSGYVNDINISLGINESNNFYYGFSLGLVSAYHTEDWFLQENDDRNVTQFTRGFQYNNNFTRSGGGVNLKAGILYQINPMVKVSFAAHSPTFMNIEEIWDEKLWAYYDSPINDTAAAKYWENSFSVVTPARFIAGASFLLNGMVLVGVDYEAAAYNTMRLDSDSYNFSAENGSIEDNFTWRHAARLGAEVKLGQVSLRGGGFYYSSPLKSGGENMSTLGFSTGFGFRSGNFYCDMAFQNAMTPSKYYIDGSDAMRVDIDKVSKNFYVTFGLRF
jgi:hypothetical protein